MWYMFVRFWVIVLFRLVFKIRVIDLENVPVRGGVILASNHQSFLDPLLIGLILPRSLHYVARRSLFEHNFLFARLLRSVNAFPVARERGDIAAVREMMRRLERGVAILAFPEGTRTHDGEVAPFKPGPFLIAGRMGVPVVPTVIDGAFEAWPRSRLLPKRSPLVVAYGKPLMPAEFGGDADLMCDACHAAVIELQRRVRSPG